MAVAHVRRIFLWPGKLRSFNEGNGSCKGFVGSGCFLLTSDENQVLICFVAQVPQLADCNGEGRAVKLRPNVVNQVN